MAAVIAICICLAGLAGFAVQRGGVCVVAAARDGVLEGRWGGFVAFAECAVWALCFYVLLDLFGLRGIGTYAVRASLPAAVLGGVLFGCGALVNGACAYGAMGRLAAGETSFLAMLGGFFLGAKLGHEALLGAFQPERETFAFAGSSLGALCALLVLFLVLQAKRARQGAASWAKLAQMLRARKWPISLAMLTIALANVGLIALLSHWTYTGLLIDLAADNQRADALRAGLALIFLAGAVAGAVSAGRFRWRGMAWRELWVRGVGGALMGVGAILIPGGNDGLVVMGVPLMLAGPVLAYLAMSATVLAGFAIQRYRHSGRSAA